MLNLLCKIPIFFFICVFITACGGGGSVVSNSNASPTIIENVTLNTRASNSSQGIRRVTLSDGVKAIYFDADLGVSENATVLNYGAITNSHSEIQIEQGSTTNKIFMAAGGNPVTTMPTGTFVYNGTAFFRYNVSRSNITGCREGCSLSQPRMKSGPATATLNFESKTGSLSANSNTNLLYFNGIGESYDGSAGLSIDISSISNTGNIAGSGTFTATGATWNSYAWHSNLDSEANFIDPSDNRTGWYVNTIKNYDSINESSVFHGAVFGPNGEEVTGISMGNNHEASAALK